MSPRTVPVADATAKLDVGTVLELEDGWADGEEFNTSVVRDPRTFMLRRARVAGGGRRNAIVLVGRTSCLLCCRCFGRLARAFCNGTLLFYSVLVFVLSVLKVGREFFVGSLFEVCSHYQQQVQCVEIPFLLTKWDQ